MYKKISALILAVIIILGSFSSVSFAQEEEITFVTATEEANLELEDLDGQIPQNSISKDNLLIEEDLSDEETVEEDNETNKNDIVKEEESLNSKEDNNILNESDALEDSITLNSNGGIIKIGENEYLTLVEAINAAKTGDTLILTGGNMTIDKTVTIQAEKNLTLDLNGNTLISHIESSQSTMLVVQLARDSEVVGSFTVKNGYLTAEDTNEDGITGGAIRSTNSNLTIDSIEAYNFNKTTSGGVVQSSTNEPANITINNCNFYDNSAVDRGGAIAINSNSPNSVTVISNNKVTNNKVEGSNYSHGGGFYFDGMGELLISDNLIEGNKASVNITTHGHYWSHGGGLSISNQASNSGLEVTLKNNQIKKNEAQLFGGGIYFMLTKSSGDVINLESGTFEENHSGYAGGAIDYSVHGQPTLVLKNALITQNKSPQGGGIWACPTARTMTYSTLGGAIIENELINDLKFSMTGHDIRFEGSDTRFPGLLESNNPAYHRMTIQDRTFLGDKINWYADEPGDLYEPGDPVLSPDYYTDRHTSFGLYGEITENENWYQSHNSEARLIFIIILLMEEEELFQLTLTLI